MWTRPPQTWVPCGPRRNKRELPTWWPEGGGLPRKVTWSLGHHSGRGQSQCQTRSPVPGLCFPLLPYFLFLVICPQDAVAKEVFVLRPLSALQGPLRPLREPHCCSDRQVPLVSVPSLPPLCPFPTQPLPAPLPTFPPEVATPGPEGSGGRGPKVCVTYPIPSTCLEQKDAQAIQTSLINV